MTSRLASVLVVLAASPALAQPPDAPTPAPTTPVAAPTATPAPSPDAAPAPTPEATPAQAPVVVIPSIQKEEKPLPSEKLEIKEGKPEDKLAKQVELKPGGYVQADQRSFATDTGTHDLTLRRLRFKLDAKAFRYFKAYTLIDFAGSKVVVDDAFLEFAPRPELALRFGKNKAQFGIERLQSAAELTFIERSFPTQIAPNRDIGLAVRGDFKGGAVHYSVAAVDGVANNAVLESETDDELEYNAHLLVKPLLFASAKPDADFAIGGAATVGRTHGTIANPGITPIKSAGQATIYKYATGDSLTNTAVADGFRHRLTAHAYYYTGPFGALAEYVADYEPVAYKTNHTLLFQRAWQVASSLALTPGDRPGYKGITPKHPFDLDAKTWGAFEVAARYAEIRLDGGSFMEGIADPAASVRRARAGTVGVNWYFNKLFKLQLNYEGTVYKGGAPDGGDRPTEHLIATRFQAAI